MSGDENIQHDQAVVEFDAPPYLGSSPSMVEKLSHLGCEKATVGDFDRAVKLLEVQGFSEFLNSVSERARLLM